MDHSPNWTNLPPEFSYVRRAAERYGPLATPDGRVSRKLRRRELQELRGLAARIGWNNHRLTLESWYLHNIVRLTDENRAEYERHGATLLSGLLDILADLGMDTSDYGPKEEPQWTLHLWSTLHYRLLSELVDHTREILSDTGAFDLVLKALERVPRGELPRTAFELLAPFESELTLDWLEDHVPDVASPWHWGWLAAVSKFSWPRAEDWLSQGRPLSLVALDALVNLDGASESPVVRDADPRLRDPVPFATAEQSLRRYESSDPVPRVKKAVTKILERWPSIVGNN